MIRLVPAVIVFCAAALAAQPAAAEPKKKKKDPEPATFSSRKDHKDGSSSLTFGTKLPTAVETKVGVDLGLAGSADLGLDPGKLLDKPSDQGSGAGWASLAVPTVPLGFTRAKLDARFDPAHDQSEFGMAVSRPLGESLLVTLQNSYAMSGAGIPIMPTQPSYNLETGRALRFELLSTNTAFSAGTKSSSLDEKSLRTLSAEQRIVGPLSVTGTLVETPTGDIEKILKAGFKKTW